MRALEAIEYSNNDKTEELLLNDECRKPYLVPLGLKNPVTRRLSRKVMKTCLRKLLETFAKIGRWFYIPARSFRGWFNGVNQKYRYELSCNIIEFNFNKFFVLYSNLPAQ